MAKAGFWLKGAKGKLAGSVIQKSATAGTIIRDNVTPKNPKSVGQCRQRALFAPIAKIYSAYRKVLEKSWEGLSKAESYQAYLKKGLNDAKNYQWWLQKGTGFFPLPVQVSKGSLQKVEYVMNNNHLVLVGTADTQNVEFSEMYDGTVGGMSKIFQALGYAEGEQITFIFATWKDSVGSTPLYTRFIIAPESTEAFPMPIGIDFIYENDEGYHFEVTRDGYALQAGAIIASRWEQDAWRRSTQRIEVDEETIATITTAEQKQDSIISYGTNTISENTSDVYLDGGTGGGGNSTNLVVISIEPIGTAARLIRLNGRVDGSTPIWVDAEVDGEASGLTRTLYVKIGNDWLLTKNTKGAWPAGAGAEPTEWLIGTSPAVKTFLQTNGVAASVF